MLFDLTHFDHEAMELTQGLRWHPLTLLFVAVSLWWVKGPALVAIGALGDLGSLRVRLLPPRTDGPKRTPLRVWHSPPVTPPRACSKRAVIPSTAVCAAAAFFAASAVNFLLKDIFERARPPEASAELHSAVPVPESSSFPSAHAMSAFAAAAAIAVLRPSLRWPALGLATLISAARAYLGVHFWIDVVAGIALGALIGVLVALAGRRFFGEPAPRA